MKQYKYTLEEVLQILEDRINDMQEDNIPPNTVMGGIMLGLIEARDLILEADNDCR